MKRYQPNRIKRTWINHEQLRDMTPNMAYILGLLWADGYALMRASNNSCVVRLSNTATDCVYFRPIFESVGQWTIRDLVAKGNTKAQTSFCCYDPDFVKLLYDLDYKAKTSASADKVLEFIPEELHFYWFLGLMDGDGCFYINPSGKHYKLTIASSYEQDWSYLEKLCEKLDITYKIVRRIAKTGNKSCNFEITSRYSVIKFGNYIYQSEMGLPRKRDKFNQIKSKLENQWEGMSLNRGISFRKRKGGYYEIKIQGEYVGSTKSIEAARLMRDDYRKEHNIVYTGTGGGSYK